eukprot:TRINITY_DN9354_c0_g3_i1.p1 TRINITY_DN9354_c0_g3~~TRINITY_DN9354_c0_g3_i1.p1  ORF type:complete len:627 (+),score=45.14 TRINITY_DN9354_c0_g3_i1:198-2078(+)
MKTLLTLALLCAIVKTQINKSCNHDTNCHNGPAPCLRNQCVCDPYVYKCKLALRQPCLETQDYCNTNTICVNKQCVAYEGKYCESPSDCVFGLSCLNRVCTSQLNQPQPQPQPNSQQNANQCPSGTFFNGVFCAPCSQNCIECAQTGACAVCAPGFHLLHGACHSCPANCRECLSGGLCVECAQGYTLANSRCVAQMALCPSNCQSCTTNGVCLSCEQGYSLANGVCTQLTKCPENCVVCSQNGMCEYCAPGYTPYNGQCLLQTGICPINCNSCTSDGVCFSCDQGYSLVDGNCIAQTSACPPNCYLCMSNGNCVLCDNGYLPENGRCTSQPLSQSLICPDNCLLCSDFQSCTVCAPGYVLHNGQCLLQASAMCPENCADCRADGTCVMCNDGYRLANGVCTPQTGQCPPGCQACDVYGSCVLCGADYKLLNGVCTPQSCPTCCPDCTIDAQGNIQCKTCNRNTVYKNGQCMTCGAGIHGCASCRGCACAQCVTGFFLTPEGTCAECAAAIPNCAICSGPHTCVTCIPPHALEPATGQCVVYSPLPSGERSTRECEKGKYLTEDGRCLDCYYTCSKCRGAGATQCMECKENATLYTDPGNETGTCKCNSEYKPDRGSRLCVAVNEG